MARRIPRFMLYDILFIVLGFIGLTWGANMFVFGASALARNLGVSPSPYWSDHCRFRHFGAGVLLLGCGGAQ